MSNVQVNVTDPGGIKIGVISNVGTTPLPASAGVAVTVTRGANSQVLAVHGQVSGTSVVVDIPSGK